MKAEELAEKIIKEIKSTKEISGEYCVYGIIEGGPRFLGFSKCKIFPKVRNKGGNCPKNCKNFKRLDDKKLYDQLVRLIKFNPEYYENKFESITSDRDDQNIEQIESNNEIADAVLEAKKKESNNKEDSNLNRILNQLFK